jgi:hypothetical protein
VTDVTLGFHVTEPVEDLGHAQRDRRLARPGIAREAHVQRRPGGREARVRTQPVDHEQRGDLPDASLDRLQGDQVAVEAREHLADVRAQQLLLGAGGRRGRRAHAYRRATGASVAYACSV